MFTFREISHSPPWHLCFAPGPIPTIHLTREDSQSKTRLKPKASQVFQSTCEAAHMLACHLAGTEKHCLDIFQTITNRLREEKQASSGRVCVGGAHRGGSKGITFLFQQYTFLAVGWGSKSAIYFKAPHGAHIKASVCISAYMCAFVCVWYQTSWRTWKWEIFLHIQFYLCKNQGHPHVSHPQNTKGYIGGDSKREAYWPLKTNAESEFSDLSQNVSQHIVVYIATESCLGGNTHVAECVTLQNESGQAASEQQILKWEQKELLLA